MTWLVDYLTPCANLCKGEAITSPDLTELSELYKKEHLWTKVTRELFEDGKLTPD